jgi:hypothetical protein
MTEQREIILRTAELLQEVGIPTNGWRIEFVREFKEKPDGLGWCGAESKRIQYALALLEESEAEITRLIIHECAHAYADTHFGNCGHDSTFNMVRCALEEGGAPRLYEITHPEQGKA